MYNVERKPVLGSLMLEPRDAKREAEIAKEVSPARANESPWEWETSVWSWKGDSRVSVETPRLYKFQSHETSGKERCIQTQSCRIWWLPWGIPALFPHYDVMPPFVNDNACSVIVPLKHMVCSSILQKVTIKGTLNLMRDHGLLNMIEIVKDCNYSWSWTKCIFCINDHEICKPGRGMWRFKWACSPT